MRPVDPVETAQRLFFEALALQERGEFERAASLYREALEHVPDRPSVMNNLAAVLIGLDRFAEAKPLCQRLLEIDGRDEAALVNLGTCQLGLGQPAEALSSFDGALAIVPDNATALSNRGNALLQLGRPHDALASYDRALVIRPDYPEAHYNRGNALLELGRLEESLSSYDRALAIRTEYAQACYNRGNVLLKLERPEEALASYQRALAIKSDHAGALNNYAIALSALGRHEETAAAYARLMEVAPEFPCAPGYLLNARLHCCEWSEYEPQVERLIAGVNSGERADAPFNFLAICDSAWSQLKCAQLCASVEYPSCDFPLWQGQRYTHDRIRLAYLSCDFHSHALGCLIAGLIECHDRSRFEVNAISLGPERNDAMRARLKTAFERFIDGGQKDDNTIAGLLRQMEIDIAVDLQGYTRGCRPSILAHRGAPVQVNYLGYPGTMGADYMDYIIADPMVIPTDALDGYAEKVVRLPDCYQPNDPKREISARTPTRAELELPEEAFVFCCFNNNYKISPIVFDSWMKLLRGVENGVLWLLRDNEAVSRNLRLEAQSRGVAPGRLVFASRKSLGEYRAQYRQADLFLDTFPYTAHTTASDALWAGLPVLTRIGNAFASRVAASLLQAVGLPELITRSVEEYEALALKLATDRTLLRELRIRLARNRATAPLFDVERYRRHIEAAYVTMWERTQRGEPPASFSVPAAS